MNFFQKLDLLLGSLKPDKRTQHLKQLLNKRLLISDPGRPLLIIEISDQLLELFELRIIINDKGVDSEKIEVPLGEGSLPPGQF